MNTKTIKSRKNIYGRPSIHKENSDLSEDSDITEDDVNVTHTDDDTTYSDYETPQKRNNDSTEKYNSTQNLNTTNNKSNNSCKIISISLLSILIALVYANADKLYDELATKQCRNISIEDLRTKFSSQPIETWITIDTVIDDVLKIEPIHPAVFLFIHDNQKNYDPVINAIAKFAASKLCVDDNFIVLNEPIYNSKNALKDYGYLIDKYKPELETKKVMVVKNLNKMSGEVAQALHYFCDEFTPLVDRAVYILTLQVDSFVGNELHTAEKFLYDKWNDVNQDKLAALITRVTSTVIRLH